MTSEKGTEEDSIETNKFKRKQIHWVTNIFMYPQKYV